MKLKKLLMFTCLTVSSFSLLTGCGSKEKSEESNTDVAIEETVSSDLNEDVDVDLDEETEPAQQQVKVVLNIAQEEEEEKVDIPIQEFEKYGKVVKTKDGFRVLTKEGIYVSEALLNVDGHCFYFDENGYLKDNVFVPYKDETTGKVKTYYIHNYTYVFGLLKTPDDKMYYIDEELGRLEGKSKEIDGKMYYFDTEGKSISESKFNSLFVKEIESESVESESESVELESESVESESESVESESESVESESDFSEVKLDIK